MIYYTFQWPNINRYEHHRNMNHVRHFPIFHTFTWSICSFGRSQLCSQRRVRPEVTQVMGCHGWDIIDLVGTSSVGLVTGVHSSCLKHVAESYLMLLKFAIISWWFWNDVGWLKIIKHHLKSLNLNIIKLIKHPNDPPFLGPYPTWTQACSPAGPWRWSQHLVEGQDLSRLKWKATVKSHGFYHGFYMLKAS